MKRIIFMLAPVLLVLLAFRSFVSETVTGKVTDEAGAPLPGVTVLEKGTKNGVTTQVDGSFNITVNNSKSAVLEFSYIGYERKTVKLKGKTVVNVTMKAASQSLEEVVVVYNSGYDTYSAASAYSDKSYRKNNNNLTASVPISNIPYEYNKRVSGTNGDGVEDKFEEFDTEGYDHIVENRFLKVTDNPLSTFSIDVDAASYSNVRRFINNGQLPPAGAVRIEEMVNYFHYEYPQPSNDDPFSINTEISDAPWNKNHKLVLIGLQGRKVPAATLPPSNLVFLVDVSGSMNEPNKLPLVKSSMKMLVEQLREQDKVAMAVYAGAAGLVLPPTSGSEKRKIKDAIDRLDAGGSTAGGAGIRLAYKTAKEYFVKGGNNRVILCTDGDFNVGESSDDAMERLIEQERQSGVFLTVLGFGMGNYQDAKMQKLADKGNGNHAYIDGISEAQKVLVNEFGGTLFTIAKDVKLQIEFNPANVQGYRLIGYENRMLAKEDFNDDKKDAGELGSGHTVTALYEVIPVGVNDTFLTRVDDLKYQPRKNETGKLPNSGEMLTVKFRYKAPDGDVSKLIEHPVLDRQTPIANASDNFRFAASVAEFGMLLRQSAFRSNASYTSVIQLAEHAKNNDAEGYRAEFVRMVKSAKLLSKANEEEDDDDATGFLSVPANSMSK